MVPQNGVLTALEKIEQPMTTTTQLQSNHTDGPRTISSSINGTNIATNQVSSFYHAGRHIAEIYELLELCLLELPIQDLLLAQRVNKRFNAVINTSPRLREKLFFTSRLVFGDAFKAKLNPLILREDVLRKVPLWFDHGEKRLVGCWREGCTRLFWREVRATTVWVYLEFGDEQPPGRLPEEGQSTGILERGSWERMFISQPSYFVSWRLRLSGTGGETYSGIVKGARTMGELIDGLVESLVVRQ